MQPRATLQDYNETFIQRIPFYAVKMPGRTWTTKNKPLSDLPILAHLNGTYATGVLSKWYPEWCNIDIDDRERSAVDDTRAALGLDVDNSMLFASESQNSYHLLIKPEYNSEPPTTNLLQAAMKGFSLIRNVEIFPKKNKCIRLPFGPDQACLDFEHQHLKTWEEKVYWFNKLNAFDLGTVKGHQLYFDLKVNNNGRMPTIMGEAQEYLEHGLQMTSSREHAQFCILLSLFRRNVLQGDAEGLVWGWIQAKHNGFSKEIRTCPEAVKKHIRRQAHKIWSDYSLSRTYPDRTHNQAGGFIARPDIEEILKITGASIPRSKLLYGIVKYVYPETRRHLDWVPMSMEYNLRKWGSRRTALKYMNEFEEKGILKRNSYYVPGVISRGVKLNWNFKPEGHVLFDRRAVDTWEETIRLLFEPMDFRAMLRGAGATRQASLIAIASTYE